MEIMELANLRKAFLPSKDRYASPHTEAMRLRTLWTNHRRPGRSRDAQEANHLFTEAKKLVENNQEISKALKLIRKGLLENPRSHLLYALRANIFSREGKLDSAIIDYEAARRTLKYDRKIRSSNAKHFYSKDLIDMYWKRGLQNGENFRHLEALSDYEQILVLKPPGYVVTDVQDKLLETLRVVDKYEAYRFWWNQFMKEADPSRTSALLTQHAEYNIFRRDMNSARQILLEAIDLDEKNDRAHELLQVVYDTGHHLVAFAIIWAVHGCWDKALLTIEKGRDCDPYNPGYTLLKAIVLRLSGRLIEAAKWLESVDRGFYKLLEPSRDKQGSILGNLSIEATRAQLVKQWYLIRYDIAVEFMLEERYEDALSILKNSKLRDHYPETYLLIGDCTMKLGDPQSALRMYLECLKKSKELKSWEPDSRQNILLLKRITDLQNDKCNLAIAELRPDEAIGIADEVLRMLDNNLGENYTKLGQNRGETLICKARAQIQTETGSKFDVSSVTAAEGLRLTRGVDDPGFYKLLFNEMRMEKVVDRFATKGKLPGNLKLLMQYS